MSTRLAPLVCILLAVGCSAIVNPDPDRLGGGGADAGPPPADAGPDARPDSTMPPPDAGDDAGSDAGADATMGCPRGCDDSVACTTDRCVMGVCDNTPDDALCAMGERCNPSSGCVPVHCASDAECDDGLYCNGEERCRPGDPGSDPVTGCAAGTAVMCNDGHDCTMDSCDEDADACAFVPDDAACDDGIDCTADTCDPGDGCRNTPDDGMCDTGFCRVGGFCDPDTGCAGGALRYCGDMDVCTIDTCSDEMRMCINTVRDADGDGHGTASFMGHPCDGDDCDDFDPTVHPGATEYCNGRDDDCDGMEDESCTAIPDDCSLARPIVLAADGTATVTGDLGIYSDSFTSLCGRAGGRDAIYTLDITGVHDVTLDTIGSTFDSVLAIGTSCSAEGFRLACDDDIVPAVERQSRVWAHRIGSPAVPPDPVRLYILVDGYDGSAYGDFTLNVRVSSPAAADTCAAPIDITGGGTMVGFISPSAIVPGGPRGTCQSDAEADEREGIATFLGPADGSVRLQAFSSDFVPDLYVRQAPCMTGTEIGCMRGRNIGGGLSTAELTSSVVGGTRYYVFVDGASMMSRLNAYILSYNP